MLQSKKEPLVPIGCAVTVGFLLAGFRAFTGGNQKLSQHLMRGRVVAQVCVELH
jgi:Hypoxia induced protein conserved region